MKSKLVVPLSLAGSVAALFFFQVDFVSSQVSTQFATRASDPGVRGGAAGGGGQLAGLTSNQAAFFASGLADFNSAEDVPDGLGPRMNLDSCGGCHLQPAVGGTSPFVDPPAAFATKDGGTHFLPPVISANGALGAARVRENTGWNAGAR